MNKLQVVFADLWSSLRVCKDTNFSTTFVSKEIVKMNIFLTVVHILFVCDLHEDILSLLIVNFVFMTCICMMERYFGRHLMLINIGA